MNRLYLLLVVLIFSLIFRSEAAVPSQTPTQYPSSSGSGTATVNFYSTSCGALEESNTVTTSSCSAISVENEYGTYVGTYYATLYCSSSSSSASWELYIYYSGSCSGSTYLSAYGYGTSCYNSPIGNLYYEVNCQNTSTIDLSTVIIVIIVIFSVCGFCCLVGLVAVCIFVCQQQERNRQAQLLQHQQQQAAAVSGGGIVVLPTPSAGQPQPVYNPATMQLEQGRGGPGGSGQAPQVYYAPADTKPAVQCTPQQQHQQAGQPVLVTATLVQPADYAKY